MRHRTTTGRIVYDRPKHYVKLRDIVRMLGAVDLGREKLADLLTLGPEILKSALRIIQKGAEQSFGGLGPVPAAVGAIFEFLRWVVGSYSVAYRDFIYNIMNVLIEIFGITL